MSQQSDIRFGCEIGTMDTFSVVHFQLSEGLSRNFRLELELSAVRDGLDIEPLLDADVRFWIARDERVIREVHGIVTAFELAGTGTRRSRYRAVVEPRLARLDLWMGSRIHQLQTVPELLAARLKERGLRAEWQAGTSHQPREYCVQHRETDLAFFTRLTAEEGLVWYFDPRAQSQLVATDRLVNGPQLGAPVRYVPQAGGDAEGPRVWRASLRRQLAPTSMVQRDYTFRNPPYNLEHTAQAPTHGQGYEHYDAPGRYKRDEAGKPFTRTRLAALRHASSVLHVEGDDARLWPGLDFDLLHEDLDPALSGYWRVVGMEHHGRLPTSLEEDSATSEEGTQYAYRATAVPASANWQAPRPPRPVVDGPQVATVVGPKGEEIHTDAFGRVMVWFPWDRAGPRENATCWIRVAQGWAGASYGMFTVPRIGHEVLVSFLDGDPDQPIVTGRTFHASNRPPYELPRHKTRSTWKSQTHKGGGSNEIRFEDESGQEEIYLHAQKDHNNVVENDQSTQVGHDRSENVGHDETIGIGNDRGETVGRDEAVTIGRNQTVQIGDNRSVTIGGNKSEAIVCAKLETIGLGKALTIGALYQTSVGGAMNTTVGLSQTEQVGLHKSVMVGKTFNITVADELTITVGKSALVMRKDGTVLINGVKFDFEASKHVQISGKTVDIN